VVLPKAKKYQKSNCSNIVVIFLTGRSYLFGIVKITGAPISNFRTFSDIFT
jgi:hypothetical protein